MVTVYTDGACSGNPGPGGWGSIVLTNDGMHELSGGEKNTTNNRMELTAVIKALEYIADVLGIKSGSVKVVSDSKYVIDGLSKGWAESWRRRGWRKSDGKPALNPDLWQELLTHTARYNMSYEWVKGHASNEMNNRCDALAVAESRKY